MSSDPWGDLASSIAGLHDAYARSQQKYQGFLPDSPAAREAVSEPFAGDWATYPSRNANMAGLHVAMLAVDQLAGLATLLRAASPSVTAPSVVARSLLETAAQAYYLLDPAADALERIRRQQNYRLVALWESRMLLDPSRTRDPAASPAAVREADEKMERILRTSTKFGLTPRRSKDNRSAPFIASSENNKAVRAMPLIEDAVGGDDGMGALVYRLSSSVTHGQQHGITQFFEHKGSLLDRTHGDAFGRMEVSAKQAALYLGAAPIATMRMLNRLYERFGWPTEELAAANQKVAQVWGRIAQVPVSIRQPTESALRSDESPSAPS